MAQRTCSFSGNAATSASALPSPCVQNTGHVGAQLNTRAYRVKHRGLLEQPDVTAGSAQGESSRQPTDSATRNNNLQRHAASNWRST